MWTCQTFMMYLGFVVTFCVVILESNLIFGIVLRRIIILSILAFDQNTVNHRYGKSKCFTCREQKLP
jgi:hypothetical protein